MSMALIAGGLIGLGMWLLVRGLRPPQPSLAEALASLHPMVATRPISQWTDSHTPPLAQLGAPLERWLSGRGEPSPLLLVGVSRDDLVVIGRSIEGQMAEKLATALVALLLPLAVVALVALAGAAVPVGLPLIVALALSIAGFFVPDLAAHSEAEKRRLEFREALSVFVDLVSLGLAAGSGLEEAMAEAARVGNGWAFIQLRRALEVTRYTRETSWAALVRLAQELGIPELEEVASSIGLAEERGARIRDSLAERAESMRRARLAEAEGRARRASQRMSLPVVLLLVGFMVFLAYPAIERIVGVGS